MITKHKPNNIENSKNLIQMNSILIGIFVFFVLNEFVNFILKGSGNQIYYWVFTDWLIDFSAGFVRRGLSGEIIGLLIGISHPDNSIAIIIWIIYFVVIIGYLRLVCRSIKLLKPLTTFGILFLPCLLPFYLYDHEAFGRKEVIGLIILLYHLFSLESLNFSIGSGKGLTNQYLKRLLPITLLLLPAFTFIHESAIFLYLPIHGVITLAVLRYDQSINIRKRLLFLVTVYSPMILSFLVIYFFGLPSAEQARSICINWELQNALDSNYCQNMIGSIGALTGTVADGFWRFASLTRSMALVWFFDILILGLSTVFLGGQVIRDTQIRAFPDGSNKKTVSRISNTILIKYFLLPLILCLPLYITAVDYGRWFTVACINFIMVTLSPELIRVEMHTDKWVGMAIKNTRGILFTMSGAAFLVFLVSTLSDFVKGGIQTLAFVCCVVFLVIGLLGDKLNLLIRKIIDPDDNKKIYFGVLVVILIVVFIVRIPHHCYDELLMIAQPYRSLVRNLLQ